MSGFIQLIHWKAEEAQERAAILAGGGYSVRTDMPGGRKFMNQLGATAPDAILIDLSRLPSQGRDLGVLIRRQASTRNIPLVFIGGVKEKTNRVRELLPDAHFTTWKDILSDLPAALHAPIQEPVVPDSAFAAYQGKALPDKLGIKEGMRLGLIDPPQGVGGILGRTPPGVVLQPGHEGEHDLLIWFIRSAQDLNKGIAKTAMLLGDIPLWIAWPKKASGRQSDLTQQVVRDAGLGHGLVDYKICSIDATWSGLLFRQRRKPASADTQ